MTHRLALNETPYPPLPSVQEAMVRAVARSHRYPEFHPRRLGERIAAWCGVPSESLAVGSGSVGVALRLLRAVLRTGEAMAYPWPAFDGYPLLGRMAGAHCAPVPLLPDGRQDDGEYLAIDVPRIGDAPTTTTVTILVKPANH